jgi:hypothetical protein
MRNRIGKYFIHIYFLTLTILLILGGLYLLSDSNMYHRNLFTNNQLLGFICLITVIFILDLWESSINDREKKKDE